MSDSVVGQVAGHQLAGVMEEKLEGRDKARSDAAELEELRAYLHSRQRHPRYEYETTTGPRKAWYDASVPPEGEGWEPNAFMGGGEAWERFDYHEESYWMRLSSRIESEEG